VTIDHFTRSRPAVLLVVLACSGLMLVGCSNNGNEDDKSNDKASAPVAGPTPCTADWYKLVEQQIGVTDSHGHGPDLGSGDWRSAVEFKLGIRDDPAVPDPSSEAWCAHIDAIIQNIQNIQNIQAMD